ncbi:LysR substrate-binding domain-containing protein [Paractinoplanes durhamensis]|uniref:LysR substrate-binding domain-containing protein n=1 Tax=Paractinoplanes durhamensis TaxID=113563 RepID=UPI0036363047
MRTGRTMTPTPYALAVREQVSDLVRQAQDVLTPSRELDLADLTRTFTLQCHDALATALAPPLLNVIAAAAPEVRLRFLAEPAVDTDDLRHGRIDLAIGATAPDLPEFRSETLGHDRVVAILRRDHPCAGNLDLAAYAAQPHILVSRRGRLTDPIDDALAARGLHRRVLASVGTAASAMLIVTRSDAILTAPEATWRPLIETFALRTEPLPLPVPGPPMISSWHQRYDTDAAHSWLRSQVRKIMAATVLPPD